MGRGQVAVIRVRGVWKRYGDFVAVRDVSFEIGRGEVVAFLGPNGAGKTTTMRMLTGFLTPTEGSVAIAGHELAREGGLARRAIGYLPETPPLYPEMRVHEYVRYVARIKDVPRAELADKVDRALASCGLEDVRGRVIGRLSRGYRQRVGLAQAIVHEPEVLVLDEPTAGLDPMQMAQIRRLIRELAEVEGRTVILSTHILPEAEAICRRVLLISHGEIRVDGSLEDVVGQGTLEDVFLREAMPVSPEDESAQEHAEEGLA
ncbi:MAG: ABC transporter ATP-binding protein [Deltaproteobacteria bacterium]|nr:ABC transporter ATP-binding protein [Deltaproteobacteria bacterium]